ncbi:hypothetical protein [Aquibacillus kalidii]|nr:hypothetical protein [Aquibacillus kalidii]
MVPLAGGVIGGTVDAASTNTIGKVACKLFILESNNNKDNSDIIDL